MIRFVCCAACQELQEDGEQCRLLDGKEFIGEDWIPRECVPPIHGACFCYLISTESAWDMPHD